MGDKLKTIIPLVFVLALIGFGYMFMSSDKIEIGEESLIKKFGSVDELRDFLDSVGAYSGYPPTVSGGGMISTTSISSGGTTQSGASME